MSNRQPPAGVKDGFPLARLSTVRTGGAAEHFARAGEDAAVEKLLRWASGAGIEVSVVGSGSNVHQSSGRDTPSSRCEPAPKLTMHQRSPSETYCSGAPHASRDESRGNASGAVARSASSVAGTRPILRASSARPAQSRRVKIVALSRARCWRRATAIMRIPPR